MQICVGPCVTQQASHVFSTRNALQIWGHTGVWEQRAVCAPALSALGWLSDFHPSHFYPHNYPSPPVSGPLPPLHLGRVYSHANCKTNCSYCKIHYIVYLYCR